MINKIKNNVLQLNFKLFSSCIYLIKLKKQIILFDTGSPLARKELKTDLKKIKIKPEDIDIIILTHNHFDHIGNNSLFKNAKIYGNKLDFKSDKIKDVNKLKIKEFKIIKTPGHTKGSFCVLYKDILFSGDTIFNNGYIGRTDLPNSQPEKMKQSLEKINKIKYKILCPGHLY